MRARRGDRLVIEGHRVGTTPRAGEVLDAEGTVLHVAWDDGHESTFVPGPDCRIIPRPRDEPREPSQLERFGGTVDLRIAEDEHHCEAVATLVTSRGAFEGRGRSRRRAQDPNMPVIREQLALSRALRALSDRLRQEAVAAEGRADITAGHLLP